MNSEANQGNKPVEIFRNIEELEETYQIDIDRELLGFEKIIEEFEGKLQKITRPQTGSNSQEQGFKKGMLIALYGPFGCGKSTMLHQLKSKREGGEGNEKCNEKWMVFDAWQYPERKDLWEGFILEVAEKLLGKEEFKSMIERIEGTELKTSREIWGVFTSLIGKGDTSDRLFSLLQDPPITQMRDLQDLLKNTLNTK